MAIKIDKTALAQRINALEGLDAESKSQLLELLHERKRYGLVWEEKEEDVEERLRNELPVLREVKERAIIADDPDAPNHILIEGDNLEALTTLSYTHENQIDVIYIDPPYNTGNKDFVYNDRFVDADDEYRHSKWLSFMAKRLRIAKRLLSDKGVIFISIDDNEQAALKLLCDEVFEEKNNVSTFIIIRSEGGGLAKQAIVGHDYLLVYARDISTFIPLKRDKEIRDKIVQWNGEDYLLETDWLRKEFGKYGTCPYEDIVKYYGENKRKEIDEGLSSGVYRLIPKEGYNIVGRLKKLEDAGSKLYTVQKYLNKDGLNLMREMGLAEKFSYPKPTALIRDMVYAASFNKGAKNAIVLDFFAGSGTTLHAVMEANTRDGGHRKCILVTNNENHICEEVTYERNKRVINGYTTPKGELVAGLRNNTLRYYRTDFVARNSSATAKRELMRAATDMLCIKNDIYTEQPLFGNRKFRKDVLRCFADGSRAMLIIYTPDAIETVVEQLQTMHPATPVIVYVFSLNDYAMDADFETVADRVELCALPAAILNAYRKVLPRKQQPTQSEEDAL